MKPNLPRLNPADSLEDLSRLTHDLMGSISALIVCQHIVHKELGHNPDALGNPTLQTSLALMTEATNQLKAVGQGLMLTSHRLQGLD